MIAEIQYPRQTALLLYCFISLTHYHFNVNNYSFNALKIRTSMGMADLRILNFAELEYEFFFLYNRNEPF